MHVLMAADSWHVRADRRRSQPCAYGLSYGESKVYLWHMLWQSRLRGGARYSSSCVCAASFIARRSLLPNRIMTVSMRNHYIATPCTTMCVGWTVASRDAMRCCMSAISRIWGQGTVDPVYGVTVHIGSCDALTTEHTSGRAIGRAERRLRAALRVCGGCITQCGRARRFHSDSRPLRCPLTSHHLGCETPSVGDP